MTMWIILRAAGIGSYIALWLAVDWGLIATTSLVTKHVSKPASTLFHGVVASAGLALLVIHLGGLLLDRFMPFSALDLLIPMRAGYRTLAVAFGVLAMYAVVLILVSSWIRKRLGTKLWRAIHLLAVPTFTLALAHGVFAGTDSSRPWMFAIYLVTGLLTLFLVIVRGLTHGYRPPRAERPANRATSGHTRTIEDALVASTESDPTSRADHSDATARGPRTSGTWLPAH